MIHPIRMKLRDLETRTYSSFHELSDRRPFQARLLAFWPCSVSLISEMAEIFAWAIHPFESDLPKPLAGKVAMILAKEVFCIELFILLPSIITPVRYVLALIHPKNIAPLWGFPYPCHCPSCNSFEYAREKFYPPLTQTVQSE